MKKILGILGVVLAVGLILPAISAFEVSSLEVGTAYSTDSGDYTPYYTVSGSLGGGVSWKAQDLTPSGGYLETGYYQPIGSTTGAYPYYGVTSDTHTVGVAGIQTVTDDFSVIGAGQATLSDGDWSKAAALIGKYKVSDGVAIKGTAIGSSGKPIYKAGIEYSWK